MGVERSEVDIMLHMIYAVQSCKNLIPHRDLQA